MPEARFCASCGSSLSKSRRAACPKCGQALSEKDNFCLACGANLNNRVERSDFHRIPKSAPWVALGLVAAGLVFIFVFVRSQSKAPAGGETPASSQAELAQPQLTEAEMAKLPKDFKKLVEMGNFHFDHQRFHDAMVIYKRALEINSDDLEVRTDYAASLNFLGDFEGAKSELERVLAKNPNHTVANFNLGVVHVNMNRNDLAQKYWKRFLELDPSSPRSQEVRKMLSELK